MAEWYNSKNNTTVDSLIIERYTDHPTSMKEKTSLPEKLAWPLSICKSK